MPTDPYWILAYYAFVTLEKPNYEVASHRAFLKTRDVTARIYISEQGINGQLCAAREDAEAYMAWMQQHASFKDTHFKIHGYHEHVFPRLTIKYRQQLVALDTPVNLEERGSYLSPAEWRTHMESQQDYMLLDVRNQYEWSVGHFKNAVASPCDTFRTFDAYAQELKEQVDPASKTVLMCCTGGIRCEMYSALLAKYGFKHVYQLKGGILNYGLEEGSSHWLGKLFVFDDRLTVPISAEETEVIGKCLSCHCACESYYNCANMDCNQFFLCCPKCLKEHDGCCGTSCQGAPRQRPYHHQNPHKPFRRWHQYFKQKPTVESCYDTI